MNGMTISVASDSDLIRLNLQLGIVRERSLPVGVFPIEVGGGLVPGSLAFSLESSTQALSCRSLLRR